MKRLDILHEDDILLIVNKAAGLLTMPDRYNDDVSVLSIVKKTYPEVAVAHRIDRDTSGVLCLVKDKAHLASVATQFENHSLTKTYLALVDGTPSPDHGTIDAPLAESLTRRGRMVVVRKGKPSQTDYKTLQSWGKFSLLELNLHTGRLHQIRVHLQHIGHPLAVDAYYGHRDAFYLSEIKKKYKGRSDERPLVHRHTLHAQRIELTHPITQEPTVAEAPLPKDMRALIKQLDKLC